MNHYKHWELKIDDNHIAWLGFGRSDALVNSINHEALDELNGLLQTIAQKKYISGMVLFSLKEKGFIAGADVNEFSKFNTSEQAVEFLRKGHAVFNRLEALEIPTVAMINGFCMGGGLELVLACRYRIATDSLETRLGLPEILLGIHPGWGGTVRLPKLIGAFHAFTQLILTGASISAAHAKTLGLVDDVVPLRQIKRAAQYYIEHKPPQQKASFLLGLANYPWCRTVLANFFRHQVAKKVCKNHYPAPFAVLDLWQREGGNSERAYLKEIDSVEQLIVKSETAFNLIRAFHLKERMKGFAKGSAFKAQHVHVIGAGIMGGDIAIWCALKGLKVTLQDQSYEKIAPVFKRAHELFQKKLKKRNLIQKAMDNLIADPQGNGVQRADVIIEAVFENLQVKQDLMKMLAQHAKPDAILATNTSSIPLDAISVVMDDPTRLVGIHFFNPVSKMELVEVVSAHQTKPEVAQQACAFVSQIARLPLPVKSSPGFLVNRVLMPYLIECVELLQEGYLPEVIDDAAKAFGMMMGPVELADTVGMDVCLAVAENLTAHFGGRVPERLQTMVKEGKLGRKTGQGFYRYKYGKPIKRVISDKERNHDLANRLVLRMVNEASLCLREGVVSDEDLLDAGMIFGTGFAPFRGGPMHYAKQFGQDKLNELFTLLEKKHGERFKINFESTSVAK